MPCDEHICPAKPQWLKQAHFRKKLKQQLRTIGQRPGLRFGVHTSLFGLSDLF
jgi:aminoglycoside N3'-acetyltransferase